MNNNDSSNQPNNSSPPPTITSTSINLQQQLSFDYWDKSFSQEELDAIDAAFEAAAAATTTTSTAATPFSLTGMKTHRSPCDTADDDTRPLTRRRLPDSFAGASSPRSSGSFALAPCRTFPAFREATVLKYPVMNFGGRIVYSRTIEEVEEATQQILKLLEAKKQEIGRAVLGLDLEWKPSFDQGIPQGKAAVMQICGDMTHCYVLHIFHSGIPPSLQSLLEDSTSIKVGVGIDNDAVKLFHDHSVSIQSVQDLSNLANQKLGGVPKQWSLSSLVETLTCKQVLDCF